MPDFTTETVYMCATNRYWSTVVPSQFRTYKVEWSSTPRGPSQYGWTCECKGFLFRRKCKHVERVRVVPCFWNQEMEPTAEPRREGDGVVCPACGGPVVTERVAV